MRRYNAGSFMFRQRATQLQNQHPIIGERLLLRLLISSVALLVLVKIYLALRLELYSDEIFYWFASTRLALAYSDLPFMASLLAGTGALLGGNEPFAVRSLFLLLGSSIPLLIYWIAKPLVSRIQALQAALFSLCLPMAAFMGLLAVPDVPLVFFGLLMIGLAERASRIDTTTLWTTLGLVTALGLSTHYRFILFPAGLFVFLLLSRNHHHLWKTGRLWLAGAIALTGLLPALWFNLQHERSGIDYHFVERHPWTFQADGLLHPLIQSAVVTPLLYVTLLYVLFRLLRDGLLRKDHRKLLLACFALMPLAIYLILAPWADGTRTTIHWPLSGYLPLLVYLPEALESLRNRLAQRLRAATSRMLVLVIPLTGFLGSLAGLAGIGSQGFNEQLQGLVGEGVLSNKMAGWKPLNNHLNTLLEQHSLPGEVLVVTDNYYTASQIAFASGHTERLYTVDQDKAIRDGRLAQLAIWGIDSDALRREQAGRELILITEDSTLNVDRKLELMHRVCGYHTELAYLDQLILFGGDKVFSFYTGRLAAAGLDDAPSPCPLPSYAWLESPAQGDIIQGNTSLSAWAFNNGNGVEKVELFLNGNHHQRLQRLQDRPDVVELMLAEEDPDAPTLGFRGEFDADLLPAGEHHLHIETTSRDGEWQRFPERRIRVPRP